MSGLEKIVVIIPFYNEFQALQRLLLQLSSMKLPSILCDGRFHKFKKINDSDKSTDGSRFLILGFKNTKLIDCAPCNVDEKFTKLMQEAAHEGYSYALLLGCDELIECDVQVLSKSLEGFQKNNPTIIKVPLMEHASIEKKESKFVERIFIMPGNIKAKSHNEFYLSMDVQEGYGKKIEAHSNPIEGIIIYHDNSIRTKERNELMKEYQNLREKNN